MSLADTGALAPRAPSRFAAIKANLRKADRDISRAHRRFAALLPGRLLRNAPAGALQAGIEPLRLLQGILDCADVIALDVREPGHAGAVHMLVTLPTWLLERATVIAAYDADDEDTDGGERDQDLEPDGDDESSLAVPDALTDQSRPLPLSLYSPTGEWYRTDDDLELDRADFEPSLGSLADDNQELWAAGNRRDLEEQCEGEGESAHDDDEPNGDDEPSIGTFGDLEEDESYYLAPVPATDVFYPETGRPGKWLLGRRK